MLTIKLIIFAGIVLASLARGEGVWGGFNNCARQEREWINFKFACLCFLPIICVVLLLLYGVGSAVHESGGSHKRVFISDLVGPNDSKTETVAKNKTAAHVKPAAHAKSHGSHKNSKVSHAK